jgi:hypothetical protein
MTAVSLISKNTLATLGIWAVSFNSPAFSGPHAQPKAHRLLIIDTSTPSSESQITQLSQRGEEDLIRELDRVANHMLSNKVFLDDADKKLLYDNLWDLYL